MRCIIVTTLTLPYALAKFYGSTSHFVAPAKSLLVGPSPAQNGADPCSRQPNAQCPLLPTPDSFSRCLQSLTKPRVLSAPIAYCPSFAPVDASERAPAILLLPLSLCSSVTPMYSPPRPSTRPC